MFENCPPDWSHRAIHWMEADDPHNEGAHGRHRSPLRPLWSRGSSRWNDETLTLVRLPDRNWLESRTRASSTYFFLGLSISQKSRKRCTNFRMLFAQLNGRLKVAQLRTTVVARAFKFIREYVLFLE